MCRVLFVCTGNTCRSPMAEVLAKALFEREGLDISVSSAGVSVFFNSSASKNAVLAMEAENIDLSKHKAREAVAKLLEESTLVLTMTRAHLTRVKAIYPAANAFTLGQYADSLLDVADPFGGSLEEYKNCAAQIKKLLEASLEKFKEI